MQRSMGQFVLGSMTQEVLSKVISRGFIQAEGFSAGLTKVYFFYFSFNDLRKENRCSLLFAIIALKGVLHGEIKDKLACLK